MLKIHTYRDVKGEYRWKAVAANGDIIADSAEGYETQGGMIHGFNVLVEAIESGRYEVVEDAHPCG